MIVFTVRILCEFQGRRIFHADNLTKELRVLEQYGLVHRDVNREVPPKVEYSLTEIGKKFLQVIDSLEVFANEYQDYLNSR